MSVNETKPFGQMYVIAPLMLLKFFFSLFFNFLKYQAQRDLLRVLKNCRTSVRSRGKFTEKSKKKPNLLSSNGIKRALSSLLAYLLLWEMMQGCVFLAHLCLGFPKLRSFSTLGFIVYFTISLPLRPNKCYRIRLLDK